MVRVAVDPPADEELEEDEDELPGVEPEFDFEDDDDEEHEDGWNEDDDEDDEWLADEEDL